LARSGRNDRFNCRAESWNDHLIFTVESWNDRSKFTVESWSERFSFRPECWNDRSSVRIDLGEGGFTADAAEIKGEAQSYGGHRAAYQL
jgi:hypothetical protein